MIVENSGNIDIFKKQENVLDDYLKVLNDEVVKDLNINVENGKIQKKDIILIRKNVVNFVDVVVEIVF